MKKKYIAMILALFSLLLFVGCANTTDNFEKQSTWIEDDPNYMADKVVVDSPDIDNSNDDKKITKSYTIYYDTLNYTEASNLFDTTLEKYNGFIKSSNEYINFNDLRELNLEIAVPTSNVDKFLSEIDNSEFLTIQSKVMDTEDITNNYIDVELRLSTMKEKLERLKSLSKEKSELSDLIELEKEITNTIYDIESLESQINNMSDKVSYTEIDIKIEEKNTKAHFENKDKFSSRLSVAFIESFHNLVNGAEDLVIGIIYFLPMFVLSLIILFVLFKIYKILVKKNILFFGKLGEIKIIDKTKPFKGLIEILIIVLLYFGFLRFLFGLAN